MLGSVKVVEITTSLEKIGIDVFSLLRREKRPEEVSIVSYVLSMLETMKRIRSELGFLGHKLFDELKSFLFHDGI